MLHHPSITPDELLRRGPANMALMVASEFWRAKEGAAFPQDALRSYERAHELMGILETCSVGPDVASFLAPFYVECRDKPWLRSDRSTAADIETFSARLANAFETASKKMIEGPHA